HEIVPRREMPDQGLRVDTAQFLFADGERDNRNVGCFQSLVAELLVKRNVRVAIDGRNDGRLAATGELLDVAHDRLIIRVPEWRVFLVDVLVVNTLRFQERAEDL